MNSPTTQPRTGAYQRLDSAEIAYITKYAGKLDSGIAFTDVFYQRALARSPLSTLVFANAIPDEFPADGLAYTTRLEEYRLHDPTLHLVNGMGSMHELLRSGFFPEHRPGLKVAFIHDEPAAYDYYNTRVWNREHVRDKLMKPFDGFIFVSSTCRDQWREYAGFDDKLQYYLPNTCAEEAYINDALLTISRRRVRTELALSEDALHLVVVATVQPRKAQLCAVRALEELKRTRPDGQFHLHIVGRVTQPHYGAEIQEYISANGLDAVVSLVGEVPKSTALKYIYAADILLLTSESEAMPLVLLEAMQLGTPVITTNVGGIPELVADGETAVFFAAGSSSDLAARILAMASGQSMRDRIVRAATERYWTHFSNERFFFNFDSILRDLMQGRLTSSTRTPLASGGFEVLADGLKIAARPPEPASEVDGAAGLALGGALHLTIEGKPMASYPTLRSLLSEIQSESIIRSARCSVPRGTSLRASLDLCLPLARMGLQVQSLRLPDGEIVLGCAHGLGDTPCLTNAELFAIAQEPAFQVERVYSAQGVAGQRSAAGELAKLKRTYRWRISNAIARPFLKSPYFSKLRTVFRKAKSQLRTRRVERETQAKRTGVGAVFNSPMQLMAFLSLWDSHYRDALPAGTPLVALIYSTNGAKDFVDQLRAVCARTGRFEAVEDITPEYSALYGGKLDFKRCVTFKSQLMRRTARYEFDTVFIAAFMSARAQKMLYESFSESTIRLFEDGIGSYIPKRIKMVDHGLVDRVSSGDCAEAHHIRLVRSVDLMLSSLPVPPQYHSDVPRIEFPDLRVASYTIDYHAFGAIFGAQRRRFGPREVLMLTQNFSDHLGGAGYTAEMERSMNDGVIADLLTRGYRVVIRPHPRASVELWGTNWKHDPRVSVWSDTSAYPVEVLIDYEAPPELLVGLSSSCLFYLRDFRGLSVYRYADRHVSALYASANEEYRAMIDLARHAIESYPADARDGFDDPSAGGDGRAPELA